MTWFILVTIVALFQMNPILIQSQAFYKVDLSKAVKDKAPHGHVFLNLTQTPIMDCFEHCVKHCLCTAFQICLNTECQLLSSNRFLSSSALLRKQGCTYYDLTQRQPIQSNNQQHGGSCVTVVKCCKSSNPCLNGGTCLLPSPNSKKRFRCKCPERYQGERCEQLIRSCRGYSKGSRIPGNYTVFDANGKPFEVFCDFDAANSSMTWTLIQSYMLENKNNFQVPYFNDSPVNQNDPSWIQYRLSKSRMEFIQQDSRKWRLTCRYDTDGVVYTDYARGLNSQVNILTLADDGCRNLEYINVRGYSCSSCSANMKQTGDYHTFIDSHYSSELCDFKPANSKLCPSRYRMPGENSFGFYQCANPQHRCSSSENSTTQTWFGGE